MDLEGARWQTGPVADGRLVSGIPLEADGAVIRTGRHPLGESFLAGARELPLAGGVENGPDQDLDAAVVKSGDSVPEDDGAASSSTRLSPAGLVVLTAAASP